MRPAAFTTIAFVAGQHGFGIFLPYLGAFLVVAHVLRSRRVGQQQQIAFATA